MPDTPPRTGRSPRTARHPPARKCRGISGSHPADKPAHSSRMPHTATDTPPPSVSPYRTSVPVIPVVIPLISTVCSVPQQRTAFRDKVTEPVPSRERLRKRRGPLQRMRSSAGDGLPDTPDRKRKAPPQGRLYAPRPSANHPPEAEYTKTGSRYYRNGKPAAGLSL